MVCGTTLLNKDKSRKMKMRNTRKQNPPDEVDRTPCKVMAVDDRDSPDEVSRMHVWLYAIAHITHPFLNCNKIAVR